MSKIMFISPEKIKAEGDLDYNVNDKVIGASIRACQTIYIREALGDVYDELLSLVEAKVNGEEPNIDSEDKADYKELLNEYVVPALKYKVLSELCVRISLKIRNMGVVQNSDTNVNAVSLSDIKYLKDSFDTYYADALNRMLRYMEKKFGARAKKYGNTGLWLG